MISLTPAAVTQLRTMLADGAPDQGLRVLVEKGGCAGWQYTMKLDRRLADDVIYEQDDVAVIVDPGSLSFLDGSQIDYTDSLNDSGFKVENPKAARSCGCGTSFEPQES